MTGRACKRCGTVLDPDGSCFICGGPPPNSARSGGTYPTVGEEFDPGPVPLHETGGAELLDDVSAFLCTYVAFPSDAAAVAVTLWAAHAHAAGAADSTPRLALLSPEPGSGKTRTLEVLELLTPRPMFVLSASPAAIFRTIEDARPVLLFDECDAIFTRHGKDDTNEDLRALLNAGHRKGATIPRCVGPLHAVRRFPVYCPAALAGLGDLPATLMSRSVVIRMRRRGPGERIEPFRHREAAPPGGELRDRLAEWAASVEDELAAAWPQMPPGVTDRPADVWEPLLAIGDAAGGDWPKRARAACTELAAAAETGEASLGVRLLADLAEVFGTAEALPTQVILDQLRGLEESPWAALGRQAKPLDARGLASRLRGYGVRSVNIRVGDAVPKGYLAADLADPWERYVPGARASATSATPLQPQAADPFPVADAWLVADASATPKPAATDSGPLTSGVADVADVADLREPEAPQACAGSGGPLDPALAGLGDTTHPMCDPDGSREAAEPVSLREDTHEEQERLYPQTLSIRSGQNKRNNRYKPPRAEWADPEQARLDVVRQCFSSERVPSGAEHYLSPAELEEMSALKRELCQSVRPLVTAEIKRLRALLPSQPGARTRERIDWYLALGDDDQEVAAQLSLLEDDRRDLGRMLRDGGPRPRNNPLLRNPFAGHDVAELVPDQDKLSRYKELLASVGSAHKAAGQAAEDAAVAAEQARRLTDEGWAHELQSRESMEEYFTQGPPR